jgi:hypothetical protein
MFDRLDVHLVLQSLLIDVGESTGSSGRFVLGELPCPKTSLEQFIKLIKSALRISMELG